LPNLPAGDWPGKPKWPQGKHLRDLPRQCDIGTKTSSKGHQQYWRGYKLHLDAAHGQVPIRAVLSSASLHDSQVAIPWMTMMSQRVQTYTI
jgi:hypothetical protein